MAWESYEFYDIMKQLEPAFKFWKEKQELLYKNPINPILMRDTVKLVETLGAHNE